MHVHEVELEFGVLGFEEEGKPGENPCRKDDNQQQTQPTYERRVWPGRTRATMMGGD